ncbi:DUF4130 domain-containing protein [Sediminispirochaeta smaragdinae]|uniref:DUF4130 domain-containing protein n=1 Tax=Sediminispirochaeta smaragdinae (strain DSM 11293 / JCM 15392 / SEBR 4228) TaxID=573413 RepID=E1RB68_SEDSS|nr:DUF4130 domain-containing protein [Sediminispirochaeta smaragdinae]ADK79598.1 hypothetical protein Spirs_0451 [Sediminispirochaeta smaragdinae DSM 11293]
MPRLSYDGSWKGFLTLLAKSEIMEPEDCKDLAIHRQGRNGDLFSEAGDFVATLERDARRIHDCLGKKLGARAAWVMSRAQAAEREDVDRLLLLLWRFPDRLDRDERLGLREWAERVATECHRYQGILRFFPLDVGIMYAPLRPRFAVLPFLATWAAERFPQTPLLFHDRGRDLFRWTVPASKVGPGIKGRASGEGAFDKARRVFELLPSKQELEAVPARGDCVQECWSGYVHATAIKERRNSNLQRSFLPKVYREYLPELRFDS